MPKYYEKLTQNEQGEPIFEVYLDGKLDRTENPIDRGLFQEKEFVILFQRVALNPMTMKNVSAWFAQKVLYKVPIHKDGYYYFWFYWEKGMLPHVKALDSRLEKFAGFCSGVIPTDAQFTKKTASPKRLSVEQMQKIIKSGVYEGLPYLGIFGEDGSEGVAAKPV